ncbi:nucleotidyltransferase family protein [Phytoactinopolyspora alkaliphila]|uniref:Nucleotidyltransferase family protein n=1 Tax=Phytoactinopolyspora alkaliphila TaxID=1783498 RepID=A0A6N9YG22_9ACTN|nr:nucleotidyltransferase family protein [Phytoactinopolyspora alkaliphila]NED93956.1 nucleotidyltransferase family protein [Phytoactinopolyspora alkaliphila]
MSSARTAGLVLAAGEGRRFGGPKAVARIGGERLVDVAVRLLVEGGCTPIVVVEGAVRLPAADFSVPAPVHVVHNPDWSSGMGSSLRAGLNVLGTEPVSAVVITLVDQPWLGPEAVRRLRAAHAGGAFAAVATYGGERGNPVMLARTVWGEAAELATGDTGARSWLRAHPELVTPVPCDGTGEPWDVDYPDDLSGGT